MGMPANSEKDHLSIVICGHVDSGKSTTTGRLIFELGGLPERELEKLKQEAERLGKGSFAFAFYMDRQKEERERGVTIACTTKEFYTEKCTRRTRPSGRLGSSTRRSRCWTFRTRSRSATRRSVSSVAAVRPAVSLRSSGRWARRRAARRWRARTP